MELADKFLLIGKGRSGKMIDWTYIKQLEADVGAGDFKNVVALFLDEVDSEIDLLRSPLATTDILKSKMHFLKGSSYYLGFTEFGDLCAENEALAESGRAAEIDLPRLIAIYEESRLRFLDEAPKYCSFVAAA